MEFSKYRTEIALFLGTILYLSLWTAGLSYVDSWVADIDGNSAYSYPVHGQDSPVFAELAVALSTEQQFSNAYGDPEVFRTPAYPFLIALMGEWGVIVLQLLAAALVAVLVFWMGNTLGGYRVGLASAILLTVIPNVTFHSVILLPDTLFMALVVGVVYVCFFAQLSTRLLGVAGLVLGVATLTRPLGFYLPLALLPFVVYRLLRMRAKVLIPVLCFVLGFLVVVSPWMARNAMVAGAWSLSSVGPYNMTHYNIPQFLVATYGHDSTQRSTYQKALDAVEVREAYSFAPARYYDAMVRAVLAGHTIQYGVYHVVETTKFFFSSGVRATATSIELPALHRALGLTIDAPDLLSALKRGDFGTVFSALQTQWLITLDRIYMLALTFLAAVALFFRRHRATVLALAVLVLFLAAFTGPVSVPRYRLPAEPFLILLAVYTLSELYSTWLKTKKSSV